MHPLPVVIEYPNLNSASALQMLFEADSWDSVVSIGPASAPSIDGRLELEFAAGVEVASQIDRTICIFDWTGVTANGQFKVVSPYTWDLSYLYTTGEITLLAVPEPSVSWLVAGALVCFSVVTRSNRAHFSSSRFA